MAETRNTRVTITMGRSGQVVKRAGPVSDGGFTGSMPVSGSKRTVRDRLGNDEYSTSLYGGHSNNKRLRGDIYTVPSTTCMDDIRIGKDDLRIKLMRKKQTERNGQQYNRLDLREKLSRTIDVRRRSPEPKEMNRFARIPSTSRPDSLPQTDSLRSSYPSWYFDSLRQKSPVRTMGISRALSPQRIRPELEKKPIVGTYDDVKLPQYTRNGGVVSSRPFGRPPFMSKSTPDIGSMKPAGSISAPSLQPSEIVQKKPYLGDELLTVEGLLRSLGLEKYFIHFRAEEVDMTALKQMGDSDLKELGIPMGPRKKILQAVPRSRRQV